MKLFSGTLLLALVLAVPVPSKAGVDVNISVGFPPPIVFAAPPEVVVIPETYVYAVPDVNVDLFFYNGWWWRPWQGRWYRSRNYNSGWGYYQSVPSFYSNIPSVLPAGEMITGIAVGADISGTTSAYLTNNFNGTGTPGKGTAIGRSNKHGASRA